MTGHSSSSSNNNNNNNNTPTQYDYATLYEEWLLQHRRATTTGAVSSSKNDDDNPSSKALDQTYTAALAARAGRLGALQCAILDKPETETSDFLNGLLESMELDSSSFASSNSNSIPPPLPIPALPPPRQQQQDSATRRRQYAASADVDAFFQAYPECVRPDYHDDDSSTSSSSSSEDDEELQQQQQQTSKRKKRPLANHDTTLPATLPPTTEPAAPSAILQPNPYQKQQQQQQVPPTRKNSHEIIMGPPQAQAHSFQDQSFSHLQQQQQQPQSFPNTSTTNPQILSQTNNPNGFVYPTQEVNNTQSWEDHRQTTNPFQTAREYAQASGDYHHGQPLRKQQQQQQQQPSHNNHNNNGNSYYQLHNPYQQQQHDDDIPLAADPSSPMVPQRQIPESLKRKFVPPKRGAAAATNNTNKSNSASSSGLVRKKASNNNNNNQQKRKEEGNNDDDDDDDDLPEELKRYGKDLVEKIQNEIMDQGESITFDDIAGLEDAKSTIQEIVCWPMKRPDLFTGLRRTPNGLLLFGPPGTGKTLIGKAIAHESGATFFSISSSSLTSKWIGEGEKLVRTLFGVAAYHQPAVVFIDEIDSLLTQRKADENEASRRIKTEFLVNLDGTGTSSQGRVLVIGATNRPQELDEAARRRFIKRLYIPLPDESDRCCLLKVLLEKNQHTLSSADVQKLATDTNGYSGADLKSLCADAAMGPIRQLGSKALDIAIEDLPPISYKHFRQSLRGMHPSVSAEDVIQYVEFDKLFGSRRASAEEDEEDDEE